MYIPTWSPGGKLLRQYSSSNSSSSSSSNSRSFPSDSDSDEGDVETPTSSSIESPFAYSNRLRFLNTMESLDMLRHHVRTKVAAIQISDFLPFIFKCDMPGNSTLLNYLTYQSQTAYKTNTWTRMLFASQSRQFSKLALIHQAIQQLNQRSLQQSAGSNRTSINMGSSTIPIDIPISTRPRRGQQHTACSHRSLSDFQSCRLLHLHPVSRYFSNRINDDQLLPQSLEFHTLTQVCEKYNMSIFVWEYREDYDEFELIFIHSSLSRSLGSPLIHDGHHLMNSVQSQMDKGTLMTFVMYDQAKRIDRIVFSSVPVDTINHRSSTSGLSVQHLNSLPVQHTKSILKQKYTLQFTNTTVAPMLFLRSPMERYSVNAASITANAGADTIPIQLFCRRLSDYRVASLGMVDLQTNYWSYNTEFYGKDFWSDIMTQCDDSNSIVFHVTLSKAEIERYERYHGSQPSYITVAVVTATSTIQSCRTDILTCLPLSQLPTLLSCPQFKILTFAVQRATLKILTDLYIAVTTTH